MVTGDGRRVVVDDELMWRQGAPRGENVPAMESVVQWLGKDEDVPAMLLVQGIGLRLSEEQMVVQAVVSAEDEEEVAIPCVSHVGQR